LAGALPLPWAPSRAHAQRPRLRARAPLQRPLSGLAACSSAPSPNLVRVVRSCSAKIVSLTITTCSPRSAAAHRFPQRPPARGPAARRAARGMRLVCAQVPVSYGYGLFVEGVCPGGRRSVRCREQHPAVFSLCDVGAAAAEWQAVWGQRTGPGAQPALPDAASEAGPSASREGARDTLVCALRVFPARVQAIVSAQPRARAPRGLVAAFVSATCDRRPPHRNSPPARGRRRVPHAAAGRRAARSRTRRALVRGAETRGRAGALQARRLPERVDGAHLGRVLRKLLPERGRGAERAGPPPRAFCAIFCPVRALQGPRTQWSRAAAARVFTITFPARLW